MDPKVSHLPNGNHIVFLLRSKCQLHKPIKQELVPVRSLSFFAK